MVQCPAGKGKAPGKLPVFRPISDPRTAFGGDCSAQQAGADSEHSGLHHLVWTEKVFGFLFGVPLPRSPADAKLRVELVLP